MNTASRRDCHTWRTNRIRTAYHEAGHAVVGIALGVNVGRVTINTGEWNGEKYRGMTFAQSFAYEQHSPAQVVFALAGVTAQGRYMRNYLWACLTGGDGDYESAETHLQMLGCPEAMLHFEKATRNVVNGLWRVIDAFARLLQTHGDIDKDSVYGTICPLLAKSAHRKHVSNLLTFLKPYNLSAIRGVTPYTTRHYDEAYIPSMPTMAARSISRR